MKAELQTTSNFFGLQSFAGRGRGRLSTSQQQQRHRVVPSVRQHFAHANSIDVSFSRVFLAVTMDIKAAAAAPAAHFLLLSEASTS